MASVLLFSSTRIVGGDTLTTSDDTLAVGGGTLMVDSITLAGGNDNLAVGGGTLMSGGQHRLGSSIAYMTQ
jgi:hypothetical protein